MSWQRAFLALELPQDVRERMQTLGQSWHKGDWRVKWVQTQHLHLTLHFLGPLPTSNQVKLGQQLFQVLTEIEPFSFSLQGLGTFPPGKGPSRVIWAGVDQGRENLRELHLLIQRSIKKSGMEVDKRAYHPHVTLGRVRQAGSGLFMEEAGALAHCNWGEAWVREVVLLESRLEPQGPVYTKIESFTLGSGHG